MTRRGHRPWCQCALCVPQRSERGEHRGDEDRIRSRLAEIIASCDEAATHIVAHGQETFMTSLVLQRASESILNRISATLCDPVLDDLLAGYPYAWPEFRLVQEVLGPRARSVDLDLMWRTLEHHLPEARRIIVEEMLPDQ